MRVVSLLPSATETLCLLAGQGVCSPTGARGVQLVARSHECDWPTDGGLEALPVLTGARTHYDSAAPDAAAQIDRVVREELAAGRSLYTLDAQRLANLKPDLILTQDLCEVCSIDLATVRRVAAALSPQPRVLSLNPQTFEDVLDDVLRVGEALNLAARAREVVVELRGRVYRAEEFVNPYTAKPSVAFLEWTDPLFVGGHWTPQLIERAGGSHPLNPTTPIKTAGAAAGPVGQTLRAAGKSVSVPAQVLAATRPDFLIIAPCGLSLAQAESATRHLAAQPWWHDLPAVRSGKVAIVDGNQMFNRPGPRLVDALEFLVGWLNDRPEVIPANFPWRPYKPAAQAQVS